MGGIRRNKNREKRPRKSELGPYKDIVKENAAFEEFYRSQEGLCPEGEIDEMFESLRVGLPASFRVTGFRSQAETVRDFIQGEYLDKIANLAEEKETMVRPTCLSWYPGNMAWQLNVTRNDIRREEAYFKLHNFLISETESGNISRQETVSMIPPLVLDVKPHHKVLDMCAAPGSKTAQLIEAIHSVENVVPEGLVVANDSDNARCYMLVHQIKRLQSPCVMVTNHDAAVMPNMLVTAEDGTKTNLKYDRILCDVPCSGDGTLRKNADLWPKWTASASGNLHGLQYRIAKRGLEMLEVGGRMVYSTCSLNPMEDEAVIHKIMNETAGTVEILDVSSKLEGLKYARGINKWKVSGKDKKIYSRFQDVPENQRMHGMHKSLFCPDEGVDPKLNLDRCIRILPHHQNTGGFFVAVLQKNALCPWESKKAEENGNTGNAGEDKRERAKEPPRKKPRFRGFREDPFIYFGKEEEVFKEIKDYFGIKTLEADHFLTRCKDTTKKSTLYFTSSLVRDIVTSNEDRIKIINTGVKAFAKCENKGSTCAFRLAQEGALMTIPFLSKRMIYPTKKDLQVMLVQCDIEAPPPLTDMEEETQKQLKALDTGSVAFVYEEKEDEKTTMKLEFVGWKGNASVRAYVPKNARIHYLRLIGGDTSKFETNKFELRRGKNEAESGEPKEPCAAVDVEAAPAAEPVRA